MRAFQRRIGVATWAVLGVFALFAEPAIRLGVTATRALQSGLDAAGWLTLALFIVVIGYLEGYRGFSCSFCPRVVERAFSLGASPRLLQVVLGPLYVMSLFGDTRARVLRSWLVLFGVIGAVCVVRALPLRWRATIDAAVAVSLAWGALMLIVLWAARLRRELSSIRERR
jgi:hypothetical protein